MRTIWEGIPWEVQQSIEPHLARWLPILPSWVHTLKFQWLDSDSLNQMKCTARKDYRQVVIQVCPPWLTISDGERDAVMCHEFVHPLLDPIHNCATDLLQAFKDKFPDAAAWASEALRYAVEESTCDIQHAFRSLTEPDA